MAHTLTFNYDDPMSGYTVCKGSKNGEKIHSPYTLQNGDVLYFTTVKMNNTINGTSYDSEELRNVTLEFADVDINIVGGSGPQLSIDDSPFILKYTESGGSTNKVSIDLTTLTGWDTVTPGEHTIQVIAKATGYLDSAKSTPITFTKVNVSTGETWVLNTNPTLIQSTKQFDISFTSNNNSYTYLKFGEDSIGIAQALYYGTTQVYEDGNNAWTNAAYKTITFETTPTGDLLTWLQANGTKQGGGATAHTLTWSDSTMLVTVNGNAATSPYTLANGDTIVLKRTSSWQSINVITDTGSVDTDSTQSPLAVSNSDIKLQNGEVEKSPSMVLGFTINYEENANSGGNIQ